MTSYTTNQTSITPSGLIITGLLAAATQFSGSAAIADSNQNLNIQQDVYEVAVSSASHGQLENVYSTQYGAEAENQFAYSVSQFYTQLIDDQEPLGEEFEKILNNNLWDLYER